MTRINKCIELLQQGRPVFALHPSEPPPLTYGSGRDFAASWADMLVVEFEHFEFNVSGLAEFMLGLREATPVETPTLTVLATLPHNGTTPEEVRYNAWQVRHALSAGVHGLMQSHARDPEAVKWFIASARYPFQTLGEGVLPEGVRGAGGEDRPARLWGVTPELYRRLADPWPLNPVGELLLGLKIESHRSLMTARAVASVPGVGFAEWGPSDMAMSLGLSESKEPPYPAEISSAMEVVRQAVKDAGIAFHCGWNDPAMSVERQVDYLMDELGAEILVVPSKEHADYGRSRRTQGASLMKPAPLA